MKTRVHIESKLDNWYQKQTPKAINLIYIGCMIALSIISTNFVIIAILLTALYLKK